jgi:hypothetical protein
MQSGGGGRLNFIEWIGWNVGQENSQYTQKKSNKAIIFLTRSSSSP